MSSQWDGYEDPTRPSVPPEDRSLGEIASSVAQDLTTLMRQELDLAKAEIKQEAVKAGKAGGMLGGAGVAGHLVLVFASLAGMFALGNVMDLGWAALIVTALWAIVAAVLFAKGRQRLGQVDPMPERTVESLKEDVRWVQNRSTSNGK